jgi:hypothetical protein
MRARILIKPACDEDRVTAYGIADPGSTIQRIGISESNTSAI